jgi:hypothetical protein
MSMTGREAVHTALEAAKVRRVVLYALGDHHVAGDEGSEAGGRAPRRDARAGSVHAGDRPAPGPTPLLTQALGCRAPAWPNLPEQAEELLM